jgi:hypothetical protein
MKTDPTGPPVLYPNHYTWFVLLSALDIIMTYVVLWAGGYEANSYAAGIIHRWGVPGMAIYKCVLIAIVVGICELVGRRNIRAGRNLATAAVVLSIFPVALAFVLLDRVKFF